MPPNPAVARADEAWEQAQREMDRSLRALRILIAEDDLFALVHGLAHACCAIGYREAYQDAMSDAVRVVEIQR